MSDPSNFTNPLGGHEVVADILAQIRKRLATDCNLRATDGYSGGYSGTVTVKLHLHAVRIAEVEMEIPITADPKLPGPEAFPPEDIEPVDVDETISIPLEPNLKEVRERTAQNNVEPQPEEPSELEVAEVAPTQQRQYARKAALAGAVSGE
jgi:hypothetical protein